MTSFFQIVVLNHLVLRRALQEPHSLHENTSLRETLTYNITISTIDKDVILKAVFVLPSRMNDNNSLTLTIWNTGTTNATLERSFPVSS